VDWSYVVPISLVDVYTAAVELGVLLLLQHNFLLSVGLYSSCWKQFSSLSTPTLICTFPDCPCD